MQYRCLIEWIPTYSETCSGINNKKKCFCEFAISIGANSSESWRVRRAFDPMSSLQDVYEHLELFLLDLYPSISNGNAIQMLCKIIFDKKQEM